MPRMEIEWTSAGHRDQDESLALEIEEHAMGCLDGYDGTVFTDLGAEPGALPVSRQYLARAIMAGAEALADAIIAYEPPGVSGER